MYPWSCQQSYPVVQQPVFKYFPEGDFPEWRGSCIAAVLASNFKNPALKHSAKTSVQTVSNCHPTNQDGLAWDVQSASKIKHCQSQTIQTAENAPAPSVDEQNRHCPYTGTLWWFAWPLLQLKRNNTPALYCCWSTYSTQRYKSVQFSIATSPLCKK